MVINVNETIDDSIRAKEQLKKQNQIIYKIGILISKCINKGGKVFFFGNGGSAADAQHISAELVGRYQINRKGLPSIAFTTNTSVLTAIGNDFGYDIVFERQVKSIVTSDDVVVGISTSGESANVIKGIMAAKKIGAKTVGLTGLNGAKLAKVADITLKVPSQNTQRIQECHIMVGHIICDIVETNISQKFKKNL
jgi:D-sedoheptulose 7-phosphate isomerase